MKRYMFFGYDNYEVGGGGMNGFLFSSNCPRKGIERIKKELKEKNEYGVKIHEAFDNYDIYDLEKEDTIMIIDIKHGKIDDYQDD